MIIIKSRVKRWGKRAVLRLDLKVDIVAVCLRERERELVPGRRAKVPTNPTNALCRTNSAVGDGESLLCSINNKSS